MQQLANPLASSCLINARGGGGSRQDRARTWKVRCQSSRVSPSIESCQA
jgi:hypothetical protein